jgi:ribosomal protein S18 acetylase RimI-like enzyme
VDIQAMGPGDDERVVAAGNLFDDQPKKEAVTRFLSDPGHHLLIAYYRDSPVGFVSGVEVTHPDKGTEMFLYELGVDSGHRHQGIGTALVEKLAELAKSKGCYGMWVLVDDENAAAAATYRKAHGDVESQPLMFSWRF